MILNEAKCTEWGSRPLLPRSEPNDNWNEIENVKRIHFDRPRYCRSLGVFIVFAFITLVVLDIMPFYFHLRGKGWAVFYNYQYAYEAPISWEGVLLMLILILVSVVAHRAQKFMLLRPHKFLLSPKAWIHFMNMLLLVGVIPWWIVQRRRSGVDTDVTDLIDGWGYVSGKACKIMMGLCVLPIARQSVWLNAAIMGFPEGVSLHRVTGWWCIVQVVLHTVMYTVVEAMRAMRSYSHRNNFNHSEMEYDVTQNGPITPGEFDGTKWDSAKDALWAFYWPWAKRLNPETGASESNTIAVWILVGSIGTLAAVVLAAFSFPFVRRARYDLFYLIHVPAAALFLAMGAVHEFQMQLFVIPGIVAYCIDRAIFFNRSCSRRLIASLRVMSAQWIRLDVIDVDIPSEGVCGTQWAYIRIPELSREWHAFSLAARNLSFIIKANGDWTRRLHELVVARIAKAITNVNDNAELETSCLSDVDLITTLVCEIDGVYGNALPPWRSFSHVLFIGGGVGVAPWLPAMDENNRNVRACQQIMKLVWIGRDHAQLCAMYPYLPTANTTVYLTRTAADNILSKPHVLFRNGSSAARTVGRSPLRPLLFAVVSVVSLFLTQLSHFGVCNIYHNTVNDDITQYFLSKLLPVVLSFVAVGVTTLVALRIYSWTISRKDLSSMYDSPGCQMERTLQMQKERSSSGISVKFGRPNIASLINELMTDLEDQSRTFEACNDTGLFLCVCGPKSLVKSCEHAVQNAQKCYDIPIALHAEEPDW